MKHSFLKALELPINLKNHLPSIRFEHELTEWLSLRGHELESQNPPDYCYYADTLSFAAEQCWNNHDDCFSIELSAVDAAAQHLYHSFEALGDYPARVLTAVAGQLGWRLVPYARWVALRSADQSLAHYIEHHCRQWCENADTVFHLLQNQKITRNNAAMQMGLIVPIRKQGDRLLSTSLYELAKCRI